MMRFGDPIPELAWDSVDEFVRYVSAQAMPTEAEERDLARRLLEGSDDEREMAHGDARIAYQPLVVPAAVARAGRGMELIDLIQEGWVGLMRAITEFDWASGDPFAPYGRQMIERTIEEAVQQTQ
jgi:RNA polymerase primary sigma factor